MIPPPVFVGISAAEYNAWLRFIRTRIITVEDEETGEMISLHDVPAHDHELASRGYMNTLIANIPHVVLT